jgi:hypothetical protein
MMPNQKRASIFLGIDIGAIHSRAVLFNVNEGKYRLIGCESAQTTVGAHLAGGVGHAMRDLQISTSHSLLNQAGGLIMPPIRLDEGVDHTALVTSVGDWVRCALIGLTKDGSLAAGIALLDSLPVKIVAEYGVTELSEQPDVIEALVRGQPEILLMTGGADNGASDLLSSWIDVIKLSLRLKPPSSKPVLIFAGNPSLHEEIKRQLESLVTLYIQPNLMPSYGDRNLTPTQSLLNQLIFQIWEKKRLGLSDLGKLSKGLKSTSAFAHDRIIRYIGHPDDAFGSTAYTRGVMALNLGGGSSLMSARLENQSGTVIQPAWMELTDPDLGDFLDFVFRWTASTVSQLEAEQYVTNHILHPALVPETVSELALSQAVARYRVKKAIEGFSRNHPWLDYEPGMCLNRHFEPVIVGGDVFTNASQPGQIMLMVLDGLQLRGISTIVLDQFQILPLLGVTGGMEPIIAAQVLASNAFINLGTVIAPISRLSDGKRILTIHVSIEDGKSYDVEVYQGTLRRLVIPAGATALLDIEPDQRTDVGFGGFGRGGQLKVTSGMTGVVIDARGRPIKLPDNDEDRVALLRQWHGVLGG